MFTYCTTIIFLRLLPPTTLLPQGETLFHLFLINILEKFKDFSSSTWKYSKTFHQHPKIFKDFFTCRIALAANHQHPKIFKDVFARRIVLAANHHFQRLCRLRKCLSRKSLTTRNYSKTIHQQPGNIQRHFRPQNCPSRKSSYSKTFSPAKMS